MVTSNNMLIGLGAIVLAVLFFKKGGSSVESIFRPMGGNIPQENLPANTEISGLQKILAQAQDIFKNTFKAPMLTKGLTTGGKTFPCRGPNCLGIFQAKGTVSTFDPFTGARVALAGSSKFQQITGFNFAANQARVTQGNLFKFELSNIIKDLQGQINILQSKTV